jgi:hypothetical protein
MREATLKRPVAGGLFSVTRAEARYKEEAAKGVLKEFGSDLKA